MADPILAERSEPPVRPKVVSIVRREGLSSVFASQVATKMAAIAEAGCDVDIAVFAPVGQWFRSSQRSQWNRQLAHAPDILRGRITRLPSFPSRIDWPKAESWILGRWLSKRFHPNASPVILQCRNATVTVMALDLRRRLPNLRIIFDCRGVADHEYLYVNGTDMDSAAPNLKAIACQLREEQQRAAIESDAVFCVSHAMVSYLVREYGISAEKCVVVPCCVDSENGEAANQQRENVRRQFGFEDKLVVAYCGSLSKWQLPEDSLRLYRQIKSRSSNAHFFAITTQPDAMRNAAASVDVADDEMTIVSVGHDEVASHLAAADVGLLLRESCPVNEVASPVKFAEYLASGLPVIISEGIGDYSKLTMRENLGLVIAADSQPQSTATALHEFAEDYCRNTNEWRSRCRRVAQAQLDSRIYIPKIAAMYQSLSQQAAVMN